MSIRWNQAAPSEPFQKAFKLLVSKARSTRRAGGTGSAGSMHRAEPGFRKDPGARYRHQQPHEGSQKPSHIDTLRHAA